MVSSKKEADNDYDDDDDDGQGTRDAAAAPWPAAVCDPAAVSKGSAQRAPGQGPGPATDLGHRPPRPVQDAGPGQSGPEDAHARGHADDVARSGADVQGPAHHHVSL